MLLDWQWWLLEATCWRSWESSCGGTTRREIHTSMRTSRRKVQSLGETSWRALWNWIETLRWPTQHWWSIKALMGPIYLRGSLKTLRWSTWNWWSVKTLRRSLWYWIKSRLLMIHFRNRIKFSQLWICCFGWHSKRLIRNFILNLLFRSFLNLITGLKLLQVHLTPRLVIIDLLALLLHLRLLSILNLFSLLL